jgi:polysaccharide deacetylase 2 family uncharacterized protein YibQ
MLLKYCKQPLYLVLLVLALTSFSVSAVYAGQPRQPVISIIIDDIGYRNIDDANALALPGPLAYAIMPHSPLAHKMAELASNNGKDIILHMPMEAMEHDKNRFLGPGGLTQQMNEVQFISTLIYNLRSVPNIIGVNNHMGSLLSRDKERMGWLMEYLDVRNIFYVDSVTIGNSVAATAARARNVPYLRRDVFLDNSLKYDDIDAQFSELIRVARQKGSAIAIGHPHPETIRVLAHNLARLHEFGVRLISVREMVNYHQPDLTPRVTLN